VLLHRNACRRLCPCCCCSQLCLLVLLLQEELLLLRDIVSIRLLWLLLPLPATS
jgi:hypothetical protein